MHYDVIVPAAPHPIQVAMGVLTGPSAMGRRAKKTGQERKIPSDFARKSEGKRSWFDYRSFVWPGRAVEPVLRLRTPCHGTANRHLPGIR